ncbi:MAG: CoA transferase [Dehalococcoidia bacterium]|nr:MAG: CoA transferase [Dehalococcoidia bacterium]
MTDAPRLPRPLIGRRIVEVGGTVPAAAAAKLFSDYGADVVKVEPLGGASMRRLPPFPGDVPSLESGAFHVALDTGKRSLVLDVETASGREALDRLCAQADLVLLHVAPALAVDIRAGVRATAAPPALVVLTEHGLDGPAADYAENDMSLFAWSGRMRQHAIAGEEPLRYAPQVAQMQWAATASAAGAAALWARANGEPAREIEVSAVEALAGNVDTWFVAWQFQGAETPRASGQSKLAYPAGCYRCADGYVVFAAAGQPFFNRLCEGIGHPELATDPRFADPAQKPLHFDDFFAVLDPWLRTRTKHDIFITLQGFGVMVSPVLDASEVAGDAQAVARHSFVDREVPGAGKTTIAGPPFRMTDAWEAGPPPRVGEHTDEVLRALGYSTTQRLALFRAGVTG